MSSWPPPGGGAPQENTGLAICGLLASGRPDAPSFERLRKRSATALAEVKLSLDAALGLL